MENATKALLIAAAVLIVIVIIALGVKLIGDSKDTLKHADDAGSQISDTTNKQSDDVFDAIAKVEGYTVDRTYNLGKSYTIFSETSDVDVKDGQRPTEKLFWEYKTDNIVSKNAEYQIAFDYEFEGDFKSNVVFWSIGVGAGRKGFDLDIKQKIYLNSRKGKATAIVTKEEIENKLIGFNQYNKNKGSETYYSVDNGDIYFAFRVPRIARTKTTGDRIEYTVKVSNLVIKYR